MFVSDGPYLIINCTTQLVLENYFNNFHIPLNRYEFLHQNMVFLIERNVDRRSAAVTCGKHLFRYLEELQIKLSVRIDGEL